MCRQPDKEGHCSQETPSIFALSPPVAPEDDHLGLFKQATVTSVEAKYAVHPHVAEFWCTVTSWAFALPLLVLVYPPPGGLHYSLPGGIDSIPIEAPLILSFLTAVFSTLYHWTLWKLFSSLDAAVAVMTFYSASLVTVQAVGHDPHTVLSMLLGDGAVAPFDLPSFASHEVQLLSVLGLGTIFLVSWRKTAVPSVVLFGLFLPVTLYHFWLINSPVSALSIGIAVGFFLIDRLKIAATHPLWHLVGGYALYHSFYTALAYYNQVPLVERSTRVDAMIQGLSM